MQEVPDDLFQHDVQTMPGMDPKVAEQIQKGIERDEKLRAAEEKKLKKDQTAVAARRAPTQKKVTVEASDVKALKAREIKLHKIRLYYAKLGHKITVKEPKTYPKDDAGIDELLAAIETQLHSDGGIEKAGVGYVTGCASIEELTKHFNPLGWQLSGPVASFGQTVAQNKAQWEELVTEFAISNAEWFIVGPGKRLIATTVQMIMAVDAANKSAASVRREDAAPPKLKEEANGL